MSSNPSPNLWRRAAYLSIGLNLYILGYASAHLPMLLHPDHRGFGGRPPFLNGAHPPPPPFLFHDSMPPEQFQPHFDRMRALRSALIAKLRSGDAVTADDLHHYFKDTEAEMHLVKTQAQESALKRILAMTREERIAFAKTLEDEDNFR